MTLLPLIAFLPLTALLPPVYLDAVVCPGNTGFKRFNSVQGYGVFVRSPCWRIRRRVQNIPYN